MIPQIICVVGPTATGKTKMGVALAHRFGGEVVSVDSMQIYRGMAIGTAAPTPEEMEGIPHHMVAVADPAESWSVARFTERADRCIQDILCREDFFCCCNEIGSHSWVIDHRRAAGRNFHFSSCAVHGSTLFTDLFHTF